MILIEKRGVLQRTLEDKFLPNICLQICGGGWTASQTANAMRLQADVERDGVGKLKGVTVKKVKGENV